MKKRYMVLVVLFMIIGFAATSVTLMINGQINLVFDSNSFESSIIFSAVKSNDGDVEIKDSKTIFSFNTKMFKELGDFATVDYVVTNYSEYYAAEVTVSCALENSDLDLYGSHVTLEKDPDSSFALESGKSNSGTLKVLYDNETAADSFDLNVICIIGVIPQPKSETEDDLTYTLKIKAEGHGSVNPDILQIKKNEIAQFTATPENDYYISDASCTNGYNIFAEVRPSQISAQTITVLNPGVDMESECTITFETSKHLTSFEDMKTLASEDEDICGEYGIVQVSHAVSNIASLADYGDEDAQAISVENLKQTEYRYCGGNPNNYVTFNDEVAGWRIIGLVNTPEGQRIKLIRVTSINTIAWNSRGLNDWPSSSLADYLNGDYKTSMATNAQKMIDTNVTWNLGGLSANPGKLTDINIYNNTYNIERGSQVYTGHSVIWRGNGIGLMYLSDFGYATSGGDLGRSTCFGYTLSSWNEHSDCYSVEYNWIFNENNQWTITPRPESTFRGRYVYIVNYKAQIFDTDANSTTIEAHPVVYLKSGIEIAGGSGTAEDPYRLV